MSCLSNWTVRTITRALKWLFFSLLAKKIEISSVLILKKELIYITNFAKVNHLYDYRPNWTPLSPVTITSY